MLSTSFIPGFALGLGLIMAIGAQNAFVLRQGLRRSHVFFVCLTCAASDAVLISAGVEGFGALTDYVPWLIPVAKYGGAAFLFVYGVISFRSAFKGGETLTPSQENTGTLPTALITCLALTWLNPHVYLDTVILLGSVSSNYENKLAFGAGAIVASFSFFFALGYGAQLLTPLFAKEIAWRILDICVGLIMWLIAVKLILMS